MKNIILLFTLAALSASTLGQSLEARTKAFDANGKLVTTVTYEGQSGRVIVGETADKVVVKNSSFLTFVHPASTSFVIEKSPDVEVTRWDVTNNEGFVFASYESPRTTLSKSDIEGATLFLNSDGSKILDNEIDHSGTLLEGIHTRGSGYVIRGNTVYGDRNKGQDNIQSGPPVRFKPGTWETTSWHPGNIYPFVWGQSPRALTRFSAPAIAPGWDYYSSIVQSGEHRGKRVWWGFETSAYANDIVIEDNNLGNTRVASVFVYYAKNAAVRRNIARNTGDYGLGVEWTVDSTIVDNYVEQPPGNKYKTGIIAMNFNVRPVLRDNKLVNCRIGTASFNMPIVDPVIEGNQVFNGVLSLFYAEGNVIFGRALIANNRITEGIIHLSSSLFPVDVTVAGNVIENPGPNGIEILENNAFVVGNMIYGATSSPIRRYNPGTLPEANITLHGNYHNGNLAGLGFGGTKPPASLKPIPVPPHSMASPETIPLAPTNR